MSFIANNTLTLVQLASMAETLSKLQTRVAAMEEETALVKLNEGYLNQQVRDRQRDLACKDLQIQQLQLQVPTP